MHKDFIKIKKEENLIEIQKLQIVNKHVKMFNCILKQIYFCPSARQTLKIFIIAKSKVECNLGVPKNDTLPTL